MPFSSGVFTPYVPGNPVVTGTTISSTTQNNTMNDIATGLSTCLLKDGTQTPTANIPMAGFKVTGLGAAGATGDALSEGHTIGGTTPAAGTFSVLTSTSTTTSVSFRTDANSVSVPDSTPTTLKDLSTVTGLWLLVAWISNAGAANYTSRIFALGEGTGIRSAGIDNGGALTLSIGGTAIVATQTSGVTATVQYSIVRIA